MLKSNKEKEILQMNYEIKLWEISNNKRIYELTFKKDEIKIKEIKNEKEKERQLSILQYNKNLDNIKLNYEKEKEEYEYTLKLYELDYNSKIEELEMENSNILSYIGNFRNKNIEEEIGILKSRKEKFISEINYQKKLAEIRYNELTSKLFIENVNNNYLLKK